MAIPLIQDSGFSQRRSIGSRQRFVMFISVELKGIFDNFLQFCKNQQIESDQGTTLKQGRLGREVKHSGCTFYHRLAQRLK